MTEKLPNDNFLTWVNIMENLEQFRNRVQTFVHLAGFSQKSLASQIGLHTNVLSRKLNGLAGSRLTNPEIKQIILTLAQWQAINTRAEVIELLGLMNLPENIFTLQEWKTSPLNNLTSD